MDHLEEVDMNLFEALQSRTQRERISKELHSALNSRLEATRYSDYAEFSCGGGNASNFPKLSGDISNGKLDAQDLKVAEGFAEILERALRRFHSNLEVR